MFVQLDVYGAIASVTTETTYIGGQEDRFHALPIATPVLRVTKPIPGTDFSLIVRVGC